MLKGQGGPYKGLVTANLTARLSYWEVSDGVVFLRDGGIEFGIEVYPKPDSYLDEGDRLAIVNTYENLIGLLPPGSRLRYYYESQKATLDLIRGYLQTKKNPSPLIQRSVYERAKLHIQEALEGRRLRWSIKLTVHIPGMILPSTGTFVGDLVGQLRRLMGYSPRSKVGSPLLAKEHETVLQQVGQIREAMVSALRDRGIDAKAMNNSEIFTTIYRWLNRDPLRLLEYYPNGEFYTKADIRSHRLDPQTLRRQVAQTPIWATFMHELYKKEEGTPLGQGEEHIAIYELFVPPSEAFWDSLSPLLAPAPMAVVVDIVKLNQDETKVSLSRTFQRKAPKGGELPEASDVTQSGVLFQALTRAEAGEMFVTFGLSLLLRADTKEELEYLTRTYDGILASPKFGGSFRRIKESLFYPYTNLLPFSGNRQSSLFLTLSKNTSFFLANAGPWNREGQEIFPMVLLSNRYLGLSAVDLFERKARSWNTIMVGSTGSGKTFTTLYLLSEALAEDPETEIIIVDKKGDYAPWVELMGGRIIQINPEMDTAINMFDLETTFFHEKPEGLPGEGRLGFLEKMFYILFRKRDDPNLALKAQLWMEAVKLAYEARTETKYDASGREEGYVVTPPTLSTVINTIRSLDAVGRDALTAEQKLVARQLATELSTWTAGPLAKLIDRPTTLRGEGAKIVYFDLAGLDQMESSLYMALALALIADRIYARLMRSPKNVKKFIIFDEAHALFKIPEAAAMVSDLYRRARSYGGAVWTITQTIAEYKGAHISGLIETTNIFMFVNSKGQGESISEILSLPRSVGQSAERLERRAGAFNEILYILYEEGGGIQGDIFRLYPSSWDYWLFTSNHKEVALRNQKRKEMGGDLYRTIEALAKPDYSLDSLVEAVRRGNVKPSEVEAYFRK